MIGFDVKLRKKIAAKEFQQRLRKGSLHSLKEAGQAVRAISRDSIKKAPASQNRDKAGRFTKGKAAASTPGTPPHWHRRGRNLKTAIAYAVEQDRVVIGPREDYVADSARAHEFGGTFRGMRYVKRPFMKPALVSVLPRLAPMWRRSVR